MNDPGAALVERVLAGDERSLARLISRIEAGDAVGSDALRTLRPRAGSARVVGVTGAPGSGKSTLVDALIAVARERGERVAVLAVDPSSPYSGGAILGDRIRMARWHADTGVYVRSMAARGHLGGLAAATLQVVTLLDAVGFDLVLVETVGVGQSEVEVAAAVDTTLVVLTPGQGDGVQAVKAGLMEIADVFVVNKADLSGAERVVRDVRAALALAAPEGEHAWLPPVLTSVASHGTGVREVDAEITRFERHLVERGGLALKRRGRAREEVRALLVAAARRALTSVSDAMLDDVIAGGRDPDAVALELLGRAARKQRVD
ncbi:MAG: methylmalonyl Co-A mutase-associated GTPase MeaB [Trueperaceae bacterium]|nr:MAG: methylmalonyl Co-A mutase-associated GTPase MeaB [Trueperaceae bacterium]